jgi:hypothetical protein
MNILATLFVVSTVALTSTAGAQALICRHESGAQLFKQSDAIQVLREGERITVRLSNRGVTQHQDVWTYQVTAEDANLGYRAMRVLHQNPKRGALDVVLGGELFVILESGKVRLFVTGTNAAAKSSESASYACRNET